MKYYILMTKVDGYTVGDIFNFNAKHALMAKLDFFTQRRIEWEECSRDAAKLNGHFFLLDGKITNFNDLPLVRLMH